MCINDQSCWSWQQLLHLDLCCAETNKHANITKLMFCENTTQPAEIAISCSIVLVLLSAALCCQAISRDEAAVIQLLKGKSKVSDFLISLPLTFQSPSLYNYCKLLTVNVKFHQSLQTKIKTRPLFCSSSRNVPNLDQKEQQ